jgi:hypothetical protein
MIHAMSDDLGYIAADDAPTILQAAVASEGQARTIRLIVTGDLFADGAVAYGDIPEVPHLGVVAAGMIDVTLGSLDDEMESCIEGMQVNV